MSGWITRVVSDLGYAGLALLTMLETVFPPLPSEIILPLGGYLAAQGELGFVGVVGAGTIGSLGGALLLYWVGRKLTRERLAEWTERYGQWLLLTSGDLDDAFGWFERHGKLAVFLGRLAPGVRSLISIPAGMCGMSLAPFLIYTVGGTAIWSGILAYAGMLLGEQYGQVGTVLRWATYAMVALVAIAVARFVLQRRKAQ